MTSKVFAIRKAGSGDYSTCLPLLTLLYHNDIGPNFKDTFDDFVKCDDCVILVSESGGNVVGILIGSRCLDIDWEGKTAKIDALIVDEAFRRMGIGEKLVDHFIKLSRKQGCKAVKSRVNRKNRHAQKFHESLGFERADTYEYILDFQG